MALVGMLVSVKLFRILSDERKAHTKKIEELTANYASEVKKLNEDHQREVTALRDQHVAKAEEWLKGYHELANSLNASFEALLKRIRRE
jgi:Skp family chaperone for outer membrane proteins